MLIKNQKRNRIFYFGEGCFIEIGYPEDGYGCYRVQASSAVYDDWIILGSYKTAEPAIKALQAIYERFGYENYYSMPREEETE